MRIDVLSAALFGLALAAMPAVGQTPTPAQGPAAAPQHVTVPSLPGQGNQEGVVTPTGALPTDSEGYVRTNRLGADQTAPRSPAPQTSARGSSAPQGPPSAVPSIPVGPAPTGKGVATGANYLNIRGVVKAFDPGKSVTVKVRASGKEITYMLAPGAGVPSSLKAGDSVRVRVLAAEKGKVVDRVEIAPPATPAPAPRKK